MNATEWGTVWLTLWTASIAVLLIFPPGLGMAWLLARREWWGKSLVETLVALPLVVPPVATGLVLLMLFGRRGPIGGWLHDRWGVSIAFTEWAVVLAVGVMAFPLMVRSLRTAIEEVPRRLEDVAQTLGRSPWQVFWCVTLPVARRGVASGVVLSFARALGEFGATVMVAGFIEGRTSTLALSIYHHVQTGDDARALRLVGLCLVLSFAALWVSGRLGERRSPP
ncbi:MAG: molybdate ABC transporter permease subunit [Verrucomicrobiales bacterium]